MPVKGSSPARPPRGHVRESKGAGRSSRPASAVPKSASVAPSYNSITSLRSSAVKTDLQKAIDGDTGPAMIGVASYPYSATQKNYLDDFEMLVASTITHPYIGSTCFNKGSAPHNLLTGAQPRCPSRARPQSRRQSSRACSPVITSLTHPIRPSVCN